MSAMVATWSISLNCVCPECKEDVDLTDHDDFWADSHLQPCEHGTPLADDYDAVCPECGAEFSVKCEY